MPGCAILDSVPVLSRATGDDDQVNAPQDEAQRVVTPAGARRVHASDGTVNTQPHGRDHSSSSDTPAHPAGWAVAAANGRLVASDARFRELLQAPDADALLGRRWSALASTSDPATLRDAERAVAAGRSWVGRLALAATALPVELLVELHPAEEGGAGGRPSVLMLHVAPPPATVEPPPPVELPAEPAGLPTPAARPTAWPETRPADVLDDAASAVIRLAALEAVHELPDGAAAARAVLTEVRRAVAFDFGLVLGLADDRASVLAAHSSAMAGIGPGAAWTPLDRAERQLLESGEPSLAGSLTAQAGDRSPLARLPAFGLRAVLRLPLYAGAVVAGCVSLYSRHPQAFALDSIVSIEQYVRPLGGHLATDTVPPIPAAPPAPSAVAAPAPSTPAPAHAEKPGQPAPPPTAPPAPGTAPGTLPGEGEGLGQLGDLVSGVAHELNNPLAAILGYAQLLPILTGDARAQATEVIEREAQRASQVVRNLLYFARQQPPRVERVDLSTLLRRVVEVRRSGFALDNVELRTSFAELPALEGDQYQLEQVFLNLLNNAHQSLAETGGHITVRTERHDDSARVTVSDDGPGIPEDLLNRIFEPFFSTRTVGQGSGMGLSIAYGVVQEHGGRLWAERPPEGGARFVVELPLPEQPEDAPLLVPAPAVTDAGQTAAPPTAPDHVLVVDTRSPVRELMTEILAAAGYRVSTAADAGEALARLHEEKIGLVVCDSGSEADDAHALHELLVQRWPALRGRVLLVTDDAERERSRMDVEPAAYIERPFATQALLTAILELSAGSGPAVAGSTGAGAPPP